MPIHRVFPLRFRATVRMPFQCRIAIRGLGVLRLRLCSLREPNLRSGGQIDFCHEEKAAPTLDDMKNTRSRTITGKIAKAFRSAHKAGNGSGNEIVVAREITPW